MDLQTSLLVVCTAGVLYSLYHNHKVYSLLAGLQTAILADTVNQQSSQARETRLMALLDSVTEKLVNVSQPSHQRKMTTGELDSWRALISEQQKQVPLPIMPTQNTPTPSKRSPVSARRTFPFERVRARINSEPALAAPSTQDEIESALQEAN